MQKHTLSQTNIAQALHAELDEVQQQLALAVDELYSPLSDLVLAQLRQTAPLARAAIVLTAGVGAPDTIELREKRILLAAALEMLYVALHIHRRLLTTGPITDGDTPDKSLLGSIILAGDYCFSRAAILAARTNSPAVVMIFATALKTVNEGHLRHHFTKEVDFFDENQKLFEAGTRAAATLVNLPQETIDALADFGASLANPIQGAVPPLPQLTVDQKAHWAALQEWLSASTHKIYSNSQK
jgi:geranylgeranyl pyrophosphate synthase